MSATLLPWMAARLMEHGLAIRLHVRSGLNASLLAALHYGHVAIILLILAGHAR